MAWCEPLRECAGEQWLLGSQGCVEYRNRRGGVQFTASVQGCLPLLGEVVHQVASHRWGHVGVAGGD